MKKRVLLIDGYYFANRCLGILNMNEVNNMNTEKEKNDFIRTLNSNFVNTWEKMSVYCNQLIVAADENSWRKDLPLFKPYYIKQEDLESGLENVAYKGTRKAKKEKSDINYDNFYAVVTKYLDDVKTALNVMKVSRLEGDDIIALLSEKSKTTDDVEYVLLGTDGDTAQCVHDNFLYFRNVRSKKAPYGEIVMTMNQYKKMFSVNKNVFDEFITTTLNTKDKDLLNVNIVDANKVDRKLDYGIEIAQPFKIIMIKSITGDKSDNILPIFRWNCATVGSTTKFSVTENHVIKALNMLGMKLTEESCKMILSDKDELMTLLLNLKTICNQTCTIDAALRHFKHNLRMVILSSKVMPEESVKEFNVLYEKLMPVLMENDFNIMDFKRNNSYEHKQNVGNILEKSIPELDGMEDFVTIL